MSKTPKTYTRLTRNSAGVGSYSSLWLANDHLMVVRSTGYTESYTRLQLSDIKAVFLASSDRRMWWAIVWTLLAGGSAFAFVFNLIWNTRPIFSAIFLAIGIAALVWNHLLGPGCRAYVVTKVQTIQLPSLVRLKRARAILLMRLEPQIVAAQADLVAASATVEQPFASVVPPAESSATAPLRNENASNPPATG
jgi:hypothetical protein